MAWLHSTPEGEKVSRLESIQNLTKPADGGVLDSDEKYDIEETPDIPLPELEAGCGYLVSFFTSAGIAMPNGYGLSPLSWTEIRNWVECTAIEVSPWELEMVRKMSEAYASEAGRATNPKRKAPYTPEVKIEELDREAISKKVSNVLSAFKRK